MILLVTRENEPSPDKLMAFIQKKGGEYIHFHASDFPQKTALSTSFSPEGVRKSLMIKGNSVDLQHIKAAWVRGVTPVVSIDLDQEDQAFAQDEARHFLNGVFHCLNRDVFLANPFFQALRSQNKLYQLQTAQEVGFLIPDTLITNQPGEVKNFYDFHQGEIIYKTMTQYVHRAENEPKTPKLIYTNRVRREDLDRLANIELTPCLFQRYIPKKVELRITVVGHKAFAAEIHSQLSERSKDDWRRYDLARTPYLPHQLPAEIEAKIQLLMKRLELVFGCVDMIVTPSGEYVFLEINPGGQWGWVEHLTSLPITDHIAEMLVQGTADYQVPDG